MDSFERAYLALLRGDPSGKEPSPEELAQRTGLSLAEADARAAVVRKARARLADMLAGDCGIEQRTPAWYAARDELITASDIAQALGKGKFGTRDDLLWKKILRTPSQDPAPGEFNPFIWGVIFEPVASQLYQQAREGVACHEFGLIRHPTIPHVGCSPDGVTQLGVMLEIKCPFKRRIQEGEMVEQYRIQVQAQMEVADLDQCDFIEVELDQYATLMEMEEDARRGWEHKGLVLSDAAIKVHAYSPPGLDAAGLRAWVAAQGRDPDDLDATATLWGLRKIAVQRIARDRALWAEIAPLVKQFWDDVVAGRASGAQRPIKAPSKPRTKKVHALPPFPTALFAALPVAPTVAPRSAQAASAMSAFFASMGARYGGPA